MLALLNAIFIVTCLTVDEAEARKQRMGLPSVQEVRLH